MNEKIEKKIDELLARMSAKEYPTTTETVVKAIRNDSAMRDVIRKIMRETDEDRGLSEFERLHREEIRSAIAAGYEQAINLVVHTLYKMHISFPDNAAESEAEAEKLQEIADAWRGELVMTLAETDNVRGPNPAIGMIGKVRGDVKRLHQKDDGSFESYIVVVFKEFEDKDGGWWKPTGVYPEYAIGYLPVELQIMTEEDLKEHEWPTEPREYHYE